MFRSSKLLAVIFLVIVTLGPQVYAQNKSELEKQKLELLRDIEFTNKLLNETETNKKVTLNELNLISSKIHKRQRLINTILREVELIGKQVEEAKTIVKSLEDDLLKLKDEYAKMLYYTYKNHSQYDRMMFILSSEDFNQAYKRIKYFQQYAKHRQEQGRAIEATQEMLRSRNEELADKKMKLAYLVEDKEKEKIVLSTEREEQEKLVGKLKNKEKQLLSELNKKRKDARKLEKAIARIIEEEIRKAKAKAAKTGGTKTKSGFALTPAELTLSNNFVENQGKLPWPTERGVIISTFGEHPHPTLREIKTVNNGIDIATDKNTWARAVFEGTVSAVVSIPGAHKAVIMRHGEFLSVYSNLENVRVKMGDRLERKSKIGTVVTGREDGKTILHLEIWKGASKLDPAKWIINKKG